MFPILLELGPLKLYSYGAMLALAFLVTGALLRRELEHRGEDGGLVDTVVFSAVIGGVLGARLWSLAENWQEFLADPVGGIFSGSGLVFYGGAIGGTLAVLWGLKRKKANLLMVCSLVVPLLLLGYSFGRIGCMLAGDGDYGGASDLSWPFAMALPDALVPPDRHPALIGTGITRDTPVLNTPLFEVVLSGLLFSLIWSQRNRVARPGMLISWTMIAMGAERFVVEHWRLNADVLGGLSAAQLFSVGLMSVGLATLVAGARARSSTP